MCALLLVLEEGASLDSGRKHDAIAELRNIGFEIVLGANARARSCPPCAWLRDSRAGGGNLAASGARCASIAAISPISAPSCRASNWQIALEGEGAEAHLSGVTVLVGERHADVTTHVIHAVGHTSSTQLFKNVAGGTAAPSIRARSRWPRAPTAPTAARPPRRCCWATRAEADLKPELEIFADDVKCAHGAAVGDLDAESLFYLRARGIPERRSARSLLIHAFLEDAVGGDRQ